jgi:hypothetical protein
METSWMIIPFTGSCLCNVLYLSFISTAPGFGITLYVAHEHDRVNVTITLDGNSSSTTIKIIDPDTRGIELYNVSIYDVQSLPFGDHNVTVRAPTNGTDQLWFDYAAVNDGNSVSSSSGSRHSM